MIGIGRSLIKYKYLKHGISNDYNVFASTKGFSCEVISSKLGMSSYLQLPYWFPFCMAQYLKTEQKSL